MTEHVKRIAKDFIAEQIKILEEFGDSPVPSKIKEETLAAEKTFHALCCKPKTADRKLVAGAGQ